MRRALTACLVLLVVLAIPVSASARRPPPPRDEPPDGDGMVVAHCQRDPLGEASATLLVRVPDSPLGRKITAQACARLVALGRCYGVGPRPPAPATIALPPPSGDPRGQPPQAPEQRAVDLLLSVGVSRPAVGAGTLWPGEATCVARALSALALPPLAADELGAYQVQVSLGPAQLARVEDGVGVASCDQAEVWRAAASLALRAPGATLAQTRAVGRQACGRLAALARCARQHVALGEDAQLTVQVPLQGAPAVDPEAAQSLAEPAQACVLAALRGLPRLRSRANLAPGGVRLQVQLAVPPPGRYVMSPVAPGS